VIYLSDFIKRVLFLAGLAMVLLLALPMTVQAGAAITAFHMDRTTLQSGQTMTLTVHTSGETTHLFAEIGGIRTQGMQISINSNTGVRTWSIVLTPDANAARVDIFANTSNSIVGAVSLSIPITVTGGPGVVHQPGTPVGPRAIASVNEIQALAANQVRLEVITGTDITDVWVSHSGNRYPRGVRVNSDANSQTWHVTLLGLTPWQQTVQVSANRGFVVAGATNQNYTLRHTASFVPAASPAIISAIANPVQVVPGGTSTVTVTTNADVNYVWMTVNNLRVNAVRLGTATTGMRTWTAAIAPTTTGNITINANSVNNATGAVTRNLWVEASHTRVVINQAFAVWHPFNTSSSDATHVRIVVQTSLDTTDLWLNVGNRRLDFNRHDNSQVSGQTRIWEQIVPRGQEFGVGVPIHIHASDVGNIFTGMGNTVSATLSGVGGQFNIQTNQGNQNQGTVWNVSLNPAHVHGDMIWSSVATFTTANDVTEVRIRDASWNIVGTATNHFTEGANNTRIWTVHNIRPFVPAGTSNINLTVQVRRGTTNWVDISPSIHVPVFW
jgi:hypothetical protein